MLVFSSLSVAMSTKAQSEESPLNFAETRNRLALRFPEILIGREHQKSGSPWVLSFLAREKQINLEKGRHKTKGFLKEADTFCRETEKLIFKKELLAYEGLGCPSGSATVSFDEKGNLVFEPANYSIKSTAQYDDWSACVLVWDIFVPEGFMLNPVSVTAFGTIDLSDKSSAVFIPVSKETTYDKAGKEDISIMIYPSYKVCAGYISLRMATGIALTTQQESGTSYFHIKKIVIQRPTMTLKDEKA